MRNKKIQILLVFVLAIGLFGLLFYWRYGEKSRWRALNGLQETYKEYDKRSERYAMTWKIKSRSE